MIKSFRCKDTKALYEGGDPKKFGGFKAQAQRKLEMLDAARVIEDLYLPHGNRTKKMAGDREGQWSTRINDQWRVCFRFEDGCAYDVEIIDYH